MIFGASHITLLLVSLGPSSHRQLVVQTLRSGLQIPKLRPKGRLLLSGAARARSWAQHPPSTLASRQQCVQRTCFLEKQSRNLKCTSYVCSAFGLRKYVTVRNTRAEDLCFQHLRSPPTQKKKICQIMDCSFSSYFIFYFYLFIYLFFELGSHCVALVVLDGDEVGRRLTEIRLLWPPKFWD